MVRDTHTLRDEFILDTLMLQYVKSYIIAK